MYGYNVGEVKLPENCEVKKNEKLEFSWFKTEVQDRRPIVLASLGCHVNGAALPHVNPSHDVTVAAGVCKRAAAKTPEIDSDLLGEFRVFVRKWVRENLTPLPCTSDVSVETWLESTPYERWRKDELLKKWRNVVDIRSQEEYWKVKAFVKDECYTEFKHARGIYSRTDEFKCAVGPYFRLIEKELFAKDWFIKKIPVRDRPDYIINRLFRPGCKYVATDHTSYEAHFVYEFMAACEFELYEYMTQHLEGADVFMWLCHNVIGGENHIIYKFFEFWLEATRMSGEMNTSLGNGFSNLMLMLFAMEKCGAREYKGVVEGDDGLFSFFGEAPTKEFFARLGMTLKMEVCEDLNTASFCGMVFDVDERTNITHPIEELVSIGWTTRQYKDCGKRRKMELLRCKGISMAYQYPACPILSSLARYCMRVSEGYVARAGKMNLWEASQFMEAKAWYNRMANSNLFEPPGIKTRLLVEKLYSITIEHQIQIEQYLDGLQELQPLDCPYIMMYCKEDWKLYWQQYSTAALSKHLGERPGLYWPTPFSTRWVERTMRNNLRTSWKIYERYSRHKRW